MGQPSVAIPEKIFFKIGEVCDIVDVQAHVLTVLGNRIPHAFSPKESVRTKDIPRRDVEIALRIKELLYEDLYTIAGAKKRLQKEMREASRLKIVKTEPESGTEYIKPVDSSGSISDEDIDIDDLELGSLDDDPSDSKGSSVNKETRDALKHWQLNYWNFGK